MGIVKRKWDTTEKDFERRKEKAINEIKDVVFEPLPNKKHVFSEHELRNEFEFDDVDKVYDKYDNLFFDGNYILYPEEKIILV